MIDPWDDRAALARANAEVRAAFEELLPILSARLDEIHGLSLGPPYWEVLAGPWLLYHLQQACDRLARAKANAPLPLPEPRPFPTPRDSAGFLHLFLDAGYNARLTALCCEAAGVERRAGPLPEPAPASWMSLRDRLRPLREALRGLKPMARSRVMTDELAPLSPAQKAELESALGFPLARATFAVPKAPPAEPQRRRRLAGLPAKNELAHLAAATVADALPALYLEGFKAARAAALRRAEPRPDAVLYATGLYYDDAFKLLAAEWRVRGARLVGIQHGGQYGTALWSNPEWLERRVADVYLTWGWSEDKRTRPVPVPKLMKPLSAAGRDVLLISTSGVPEPHELFPAPMGPQWRRFFEARSRFLDACGPDLRKRLRARLFPRDYGWGDRAELAARFADVRLDGEADLSRSVSQAALVVTDHPGTVMLELLAQDVPSVHFWQPELWEARPAAQAAFEALAQAGIVHFDAESAARHAASVAAEPSAWWSAAETAGARAAFLSRYGLTSPDWARRWVENLRAAP